MAVKELFNRLFSDAEASGGVEYVFTLVRVDGITRGPDPLLAFEEVVLSARADENTENLRKRYCSIALPREPLELIADLIRCIQHQRYSPAPFNHLWRGRFPNFQAPAPIEVLNDLMRTVEEAGQADLATELKRAYPVDVLAVCSAPGTAPHDSLVTAVEACESFLGGLFAAYKMQLKKFGPGSQLYKLPRFEVMELLANEEVGLYGVKIHFSNGSTSHFTRTATGTECVNMAPRVDGVEFQVGDLDALRDEWRVGDKRLYEIGLPSRYNKIGEWKPLIYPGKSDDLQKEAVCISDDPDVQGAFFYRLCTGHRVIEFAMRATIELPVDNVTIGEKLHLSKCDRRDIGDNWMVYDGWLEIDNTDAEYLRSAVAAIGVAVNRFAFAYGGIVEWRVKYRMQSSPSGIATPNQEDLKVFDQLLRKFPMSSEAIVLDEAMDWYNRARLSRNSFIAFLCYYISIESVVGAVVEGAADFSLGYRAESRDERRRLRLQCIQDKHDELYGADPEAFVQQAYFECLVGVTERARRIAALVFGPDHPYVNALFKKGEHMPLSQVRGQVAHGVLSLADREDEAFVRARLPEIAEISREFLARLALGLRAGTTVPDWSHHYKAGFSMADPRSVMIATREDGFPTKDWRIKPEWCE